MRRETANNTVAVLFSRSSCGPDDSCTPERHTDHQIVYSIGWETFPSRICSSSQFYNTCWILFLDHCLNLVQTIFVWIEIS